MEVHRLVGMQGNTLGISSIGAAFPTFGREGAATPRYVSSTVGGGFTLSLSTCRHAAESVKLHSR